MGSGSETSPFKGLWLREAEAVLVTGIWCMLREIELVNIELKDVELRAGSGCGIATLCVAASKVDWRAKGTKRHHGCACPSRWCPVMALRALAEAAKGGDGDTPLVVTFKGDTPTKACVCKEKKV